MGCNIPATWTHECKYNKTFLNKGCYKNNVLHAPGFIALAMDAKIDHYITANGKFQGIFCLRDI